MTMLAVIGITIASTHLGPMDASAHRTLATPGAYVVLHSGLTFGAYRNTLARKSLHLGYTHETGSRWAVSAGVVTGYPASRYAPYVAVSYRFGESAGVRAIAMPQRTMPLAVAYEVSR